ncbi:MAG: HAD family phosphatase [Planctomycetaceae bacterium]|jgi:beta-phosphoglucomutase|nr:HAD family phosphatase [Planctomycetaceae bacterium]
MKHFLAIFDLDGTLFDTFPANFLSYQTALDEHGYKISEQYFCENCQGKYYREFLPPVLGKIDESLLQSIHKRKQILYKTYLNHVRINRHLFNILEGIKNTYYAAIVTTASRQNCTELLEYFQKINCFDLVITREDVTKSKPDPEGFTKTIKHFNITPENTIIFEDSIEGINAANITGATVIQINKF